jgi:hypothetical protein
MKYLQRAAMVAAFAFASLSITGVAAEAGCRSCNSASRTIVKTNYKYNTVQRVHNVTRYRDVNQVRNVNRVRNVTRTNYVNVVHRTVNVTRVQPVTRINVVTRVHPVTHVHTVTRVHNHTVYQNSRRAMAQVVNLGSRTVSSSSTVVMPARIVMASNSTVNVGGGSSHTSCGCH